mgnify:CR=1 FL=1
METNQNMDDCLEFAINRLPDILKKDLDQPLCVCNQVNKIDIIRAIAAGVDSIDLLQQQTGATDGNGCCRRQVDSLFKHLNASD